MNRQNFAMFGLVGLLLCSQAAGPTLAALDAVPLYEPVDIGQIIRDTQPNASTVSVAALNEDGHTVGFAVVDSVYRAFVFTEAHGVAWLPGIAGYTYHKAADISNPDARGVVRIAGSALPSTGSPPGGAVMWLYDTIAGNVLETIDVGILPGYTSSSLAGVNNQGIAIGRCVGGSSVPFTLGMVFDEGTRTIHPVDLPFAPVGINDSNQVAGGTFHADLAPAAGAGRS